MNGRQFGAPEPRSTPERGSAPSRSISDGQPVEAFRATKEPDSANASLRTALETEKQRNSQHGAPKHESSRRGSRRIVATVIWAVAIILILAAAWFFGSKMFGGGLVGINKSGYQAIFLTNGQTYFGKLQASGADYLKLSDVYYLDSQPSATGDTTTSSKTTDSNTSSQNNLQLFKMTDATVIGPDDAMYISTKQVLLYENLKPDSKVVQSIQKYQQSH